MMNYFKNLNYDLTKKKLESRKLDFSLWLSVILGLLPIAIIILSIYVGGFEIHYLAIIAWIILTFGSIIYFWINIMIVELKVNVLWFILTLIFPVIGIIFYFVLYRPYLKK